MRATRRLWYFRYQRNSKERMMGLGSAAVVSLDAARKAALDARELLAKGIDPIDKRQAGREAERRQAASRITFATVAANYIAAHEAGWRSAKTAEQWRNSIKVTPTR